MRLIYFLLKFTLNYTLRVFYRRVKLVNSPKEFFGRTIYVSNHAAAFMDPLVVALYRRPIVFFMTRSDVFTKYTRAFLWLCQMLPIYREHDGFDTRSKNDVIFEKCAKILKYKRNLLIFGEGFTDDTFIRRLKPVKKGAVKIGFSALEKINWEKKIYIAAVGCNYTEPSRLRSDILIATSDGICLNDYRTDYEENPTKAVTMITRRVEQLMQQQITHVQDANKAPFHEQIMMITRKGMNNDCYDASLSLKERWQYSQGLANWMNEQSFEQGNELSKLQEESDSYFKLLERFKVEENMVHWKKTGGNRLKELTYLLLLFPLMLIGAFHCAIPYILVKRFVEKSFSRPVFWSAVKLIGTKFMIAIFNIPFIFVIYYYVHPSWWVAIGYFLTIGLTGLAAYQWFTHLKRFKTKGQIQKADLEKVIGKRDALEARINSLVPKEF